MTGGASLQADFKSKNKGILVDFTFERKKGCFWNPLNLLGGSGGFNFGSGRQLNTGEREELQKRVKHLEKRLFYITEKIDKCEQSKQEEDFDDQEQDQDVSTEDLETDQGEKDQNLKTSQNYMVQLRQHKLVRKHGAKDHNKFATEKNIHIKDMKGKYRQPMMSREAKSGAWDVKNSFESKSHVPWECKSSRWDNAPTWENKSTTWENKSAAWEKKPTWDNNKSNPWNGKNTPWEAKSANFEKSTFKQVSDQCVMQTQIDERDVRDLGSHQGKPWCESPPGDEFKRGNRNPSDEPVTKRNIKTIIDEAVVDSIGKTLQKYFKEGLDSYIKKRVESAVHLYNDVSCYAPHTQASFSSRQKTNTSNSSDETQEYQSRMKATEEEFPKERSAIGKTISSVTTTTTSLDPKSILGRSKLTPKSAHMTLKYKYSDVRSWTSKTDGLKPVSAPSYIKDVLSGHSQTAESKTLQILKANSMKPFPSDRNIQRKFFRKKMSKDRLS